MEGVVRVPMRESRSTGVIELVLQGRNKGWQSQSPGAALPASGYGCTPGGMEFCEGGALSLDAEGAPHSGTARMASMKL